MTWIVILVLLLGLLLVAKSRMGSAGGGPTPPKALRENTIRRQNETRGHHQNYANDGWEEE